MKITILYGKGLSSENNFSSEIIKISEKLKNKHKIDLFMLDEMKLNYCIGCWTCWWETPGLCVHKDEGKKIFASIINSDLFIISSPLIAGFLSFSVKKIIDRLIVLLHPYIKFVNNESHHKKRYKKYPEFGLILKKEKDTDIEDVKIIEDIFNRFAINFHSKQKFLKFIDDYTENEHAEIIQDSISKKKATVKIIK